MRTIKNPILRTTGSLRDLLPTQSPADKTPLYKTAANSPRDEAAQLAQQMVGSVGTLLAPLIPVAILCIGIYVTSIEAGGGREVNKQECGCDCWDGRFKGRHGAGGYKSIYFNLEGATIFLVAWSFIWVHALGFCMQRIWQLFMAGRLSYAALVPALLTFYPMFYGAWATWNYINDRFYIMLRSQLFFQTTELIPAYFIVHLLDRQNYKEVPPLAAVLGLSVSVVHVLLALKERVLWGLFLPGIHTVNARDVMLVAGDASCLVFFARLFHSFKLRQQEQLQLVPWGVGIVLGLLVVYIAGLGYKYQ